jgi:hypothetical protein
MYQAEYCTDCGNKTLRKTYPCDCQKTAHNSDYAKCADAIMELFECENSLVRQALKQIIEKHFA